MLSLLLILGLVAPNLAILKVDVQISHVKDPIGYYVNENKDPKQRSAIKDTKVYQGSQGWCVVPCKLYPQFTFTPESTDKEAPPATKMLKQHANETMNITGEVSFEDGNWVTFDYPETWKGALIGVQLYATEANSSKNLVFEDEIRIADPYSDRIITTDDKQIVMTILSSKKDAKEQPYPVNYILKYRVRCEDGQHDNQEEACCPMDLKGIGHFTCENGKRICAREGDVYPMRCATEPEPNPNMADPSFCNNKGLGNYPYDKCSQYYVACSYEGKKAFAYKMPCSTDWNGEKLYFTTHFSDSGEMVGMCVPKEVACPN